MAKKKPIRLVEFQLREKKVLRINAWVWKGREEAERFGYKGDSIYKPVIVDAEGRSHWSYRGTRGIPTSEEWREMCKDWEARLKNSEDKKYLRRVRNVFYPMWAKERASL